MNSVTSNLISASAGTGKTYKLASRFISLLALGYPAERLIALTYTRNAAGEFKSNILKALAKGAESPEEAEKLTQRILATLNGAKAGDVPLCPQGVDVKTLNLGQEKYRAILRDMIRKLPQLNLSTLDSFFSKLVGTNCLKLGYPSMEQMDEAVEKKARKFALNAMIQEGTEENEEALLELFHDVSGEGKNAFAALEDNVAAYHDEYLKTKDSADHVWGALEPFGFIDTRILNMLEESHKHPANEVKAIMEDILDESAASINDLLDSIKQSGIKLNSYVVKGCANLVKNLRKGDGKLNTTTVKWLYATDSKCEEEAELRRLVRETRDIIVQMSATLKTRAVLSLLRLYDRRYQDDIKSTGKLVFADMPRLVAKHLLNEDDLGGPANIAYRMDGQLDHWMLDEFQDTSPEQWRALKVLIKEIRDEAGLDAMHKCAERSVFVVGDEKQSIYGWRGATPELFGYLTRDEDGWDVLQCTRQNESFRSADAIMGEAKEVDGVYYGFVNDLFLHIPGLTNDKREEFSQHNIAPVNRDKVGYTCVEKIVPQKGENDAAVLEEMCRRMAKVLTDEVDFMNKDLSAAILVRTNREVHDICRWFEKDCPEIPVVSLTDELLSNASLLGEMFLHFFKWMQHPNGAFSENMLLHSPLNVRETPEESAAQAWRRWRETLNNKGCAACIAKLADCRAAIRKDRAYREWLNEARTFDAKGGTLDEWVLYMSHLKNKTVAPANCVHVMTFHKSKGLGYDVALLPFSSSRPAVTSGTLFYKEVLRNKDTEETLGLLVNPGVKDEGVPGSPYWQLAQRRMRAQVIEVLNMLYVGVTRAKLANYIFINTKEKAEGKGQDDLSLSFPEMLDFAFAGRFVEQKAEWGNPRWADFAEDKKQEYNIEADIQQPTRTYRRRVSPSKTDAEQGSLHVSVNAAYEEEPPQVDEQGGDAAEFGTVVHALFEQVEWLGQGAEPGWLAAPQSEEEKLVAAALQVPEVRVLYTQQADQVAYNEQNIDAISDSDWVSGTLDRLVLTHSADGNVTAAHIMDFKTDIRRGTTVEEQNAHLRKMHSAQMKSYRELISAAFKLPEESVRVTLISCPRDGAPARAVPWP